jgi:hypothetical protein
VGRRAGAAGGAGLSAPPCRQRTWTASWTSTSRPPPSEPSLLSAAGTTAPHPSFNLEGRRASGSVCRPMCSSFPLPPPCVLVDRIYTTLHAHQGPQCDCERGVCVGQRLHNVKVIAARHDQLCHLCHPAMPAPPHTHRQTHRHNSAHASATPTPYQGADQPHPPQLRRKGRALAHKLVRLARAHCHHHLPLPLWNDRQCARGQAAARTGTAWADVGTAGCHCARSPHSVSPAAGAMTRPLFVGVRTRWAGDSARASSSVSKCRQFSVFTAAAARTGTKSYTPLTRNSPARHPQPWSV